MKKGITFVLTGAAGDLTKRKLLLAIYNLFVENKLKDFAVIGAIRSQNLRKSSLNEEDKKFFLRKKIISAIRREFGGHSVKKQNAR